MEHKTCTPFAVKVEDAVQGIVTGIITVFGVVDGGRDVAHPGSFKKTIQERRSKIRVLDAHRTESGMNAVGTVLDIRELGKSELPAELLTAYPEATGGVYAKTQFLMDTPEGKGIFLRIQSGAIDEWSYGYDAVDVDFSSQKADDGEDIEIRNLRQIRLYEYSPVLWGMVPGTGVLDAKHADQDVPADTASSRLADLIAMYDKGEVGLVHADKEMADDGPRQRLGDVLQGSIHQVFTNLCDTWYITGYLDRAERIQLSGLIGRALDILSVGITSDIGERRVYGFEYRSAIVDMMTKEEKAGRVLSGRNATRLTSALQTLLEVLDSAGVEVPQWMLTGEEDEEDLEKGDPPAAEAGDSDKAPDEEGDDSSASEAAANEKQAGPGSETAVATADELVTPPTANLAELINLELEEIGLYV